MVYSISFERSKSSISLEYVYYDFDERIMKIILSIFIELQVVGKQLAKSVWFSV